MQIATIYSETRVFLVVDSGYAFLNKENAQQFCDDQQWKIPPKIVRVPFACLPRNCQIIVHSFPEHKSAVFGAS